MEIREQGGQIQNPSAHLSAKFSKLVLMQRFSLDSVI